jgi:hypothetical protein
MPHVGKFRQVAANGLQRDVKLLRQIVDHHPAFKAGYVEDLALTKAERHVLFLGLRKISLIFVQVPLLHKREKPAAQSPPADAATQREIVRLQKNIGT